MLTSVGYRPSFQPRNSRTVRWRANGRPAEVEHAESCQRIMQMAENSLRKDDKMEKGK